MKTSINVTKAARNFAGGASRAHYLAAEIGKVCTGSDLAKALARARMRDEEARSWRRELQAARKVLKVPSTRS